jgi:hypothetical protein
LELIDLVRPWSRACHTTRVEQDRTTLLARLLFEGPALGCEELLFVRGPALGCEEGLESIDLVRPCREPHYSAPLIVCSKAGTGLRKAWRFD